MSHDHSVSRDRMSRDRSVSHGHGMTRHDHGMITVLLRPEDLTGDHVELEGAIYRHLFRARRLPAGVRVRVVDGLGRACWAEVTRVERRRAVISLADPAPDNEPAYHLHLRVAALRSERASWLVEKATEIGFSPLGEKAENDWLAFLLAASPAAASSGR